ncbi:MAG: hypothetical protein U0X20_32085 [Caldilineaceae bacterium]
MRVDKIERLLTWFLIAVGGVSSALGLLDAFGVDISVIVPKSVTGITLFLLGLLATTIGLERFSTLHNLKGEMEQLQHDVQGLPGQLDAKVGELESIVGEAVGGRYIYGRDKIYQVLGRQAESAERHIRAIIVGYEKRSPKELAETVAKRIQTVERGGKSLLSFDVLIIGYKNEQPPMRFVEWAMKRFETYSKYGVSDRVSLRVLELERTFLLFDTYVVDHKTVLLAFSGLQGSEEMSGAIVFEGSEAIASDFIEWFDDAFHRATIWGEWCKKWNIQLS